MKSYKPIPAGAHKVFVSRWWCGDESCNCHRYDIKVKLPPSHPDTPHWLKTNNRTWYRTIHEGVWFNSEDTREDWGKETLADVRKDLEDVCAFYGIEVNWEDGIWDWEGERRLE